MTKKDDKSNNEFLDSLKNFYGAMAQQPFEIVRQSMDMNNQIIGALSGKTTLEPMAGDKRFSDPIWSSSPAYRILLQTYLAWNQSNLKWVDSLDLDARDKDRMKLLATAMMDTLSPTNTLLGNPVAIKKTLETGGANVFQGLQNFVDDMANNNGMPSSVDKSKFKVGENVACTPGQVVYRDDLLELIQYVPQTDKVHGTPVMIVPPQINKFYVWDLAPDRSVIEFLLQQGFPVFIVSWKNPNTEDADCGLDNYVSALDIASEAVMSISGVKQLHLAGACSGGITTSALLGYWAAKGIDRARSVTLLVTILDTDGASNTSMGLFANLETLSLAKKLSRTKGVVKGTDLAKVFAWLRPNDLIWAYWINNYLLGQNPPAFDILFWNSDTTRMTAELHSSYMDLLADNGFKTAGGLTVLGEPVDLQSVNCDAYILGGTTDHITPWEGCYRSVNLFGGNVDYVLSSSGHIQAIVNPPSNRRAKYRISTTQHEDPSAFLENSQEVEGTWWVNWAEWLQSRSDKEKAAPKVLGNKKHAPIGAAPGLYVHEMESP